MDNDQLRVTIHRERGRLMEMLRSLDDAEWDRPSLCAGWRVRDDAAAFAWTRGFHVRRAAAARRCGHRSPTSRSR